MGALESLESYAWISKEGHCSFLDADGSVPNIAATVRDAGRRPPQVLHAAHSQRPGQEIYLPFGYSCPHSWSAVASSMRWVNVCRCALGK